MTVKTLALVAAGAAAGVVGAVLAIIGGLAEAARDSHGGVPDRPADQ